MQSMIKMINVSKTYRNAMLADSINLELYDNMIYGFVGENGSGKSVLFKLITGYMRPDKGTIIIKGRKLSKEYDFPDDIGVLIESPGFLWYETAKKNLMYLASINKKITETDVEAAIEMVGLDPKSRKRVGKYSLGMKQRLGIAQAIMEKPDILILDEPTNGLDENGVILIRKLIKDYKAEGRVILLSSHNRYDIDSLCDKVYRLKAGTVSECF